jgi:hypothetical protein
MAVITVLTSLIFLQLIGIHILRLIGQRRSEAFLRTWRPLLAQSLAEDRPELPHIGKDDLVTFMCLWNHLSESVRGKSRDSLNRLARRAGIDRAALLMLKKGGVRKRSIAIAALGYLREKTAWDELRLILTSSNMYLSLAAARALVLIDEKAAVPLLIPQIISRKDWAHVKIASILREASADAVSGPFAEACLNAPPDKLPRLIRYLDTVHYGAAKAVVNKLLEASTDEEVLSACLQVLKDPAALDIVRKYTDHACWFIRVQAASVLGRIGTEADRQTLVDLLSDSQWWVRYRAAQALSNMPFVSMDELRTLRTGHPDRFARDILSQVIAEREGVKCVLMPSG